MYSLYIYNDYQQNIYLNAQVVNKIILDEGGNKENIHLVKKSYYLIE